MNPNTMQKAFAELERSGLIMTQRTSGRTVTENTELISNTREKLAAGHMRIFIDNMQELGYDTGRSENSWLKYSPERPGIPVNNQERRKINE